MLGGTIGAPRMKLKDITEWSDRCSTPLPARWTHLHPLRTVCLLASLWGTSIIGLAVQCPDGRYFGSIRVPGQVYDHVVEFLNRNQGRKLYEVMDAEIDISDVIQ
jgi:hypothetical protein